MKPLGCSTVLPACPVASKVFKKRKGAQTSGIGGGMKGGTGPKTGVELRYYKPIEHKFLSMEEKYFKGKFAALKKQHKKDMK